MASRDEVKALIDQLPDNLNPARMNLESALHPPVPSPKVEQIMRRSEEFQKQLNSCKPDADPRRYAGFMLGRVRLRVGDARRPGEHAYSWWENITYVTHRMMLHAGRELDIVERLHGQQMK
jgi:hypothetical protein